MIDTKKQAKKDLINRVNESIRKANNGTRRNFGFLTKPLNRNSINKAVQIARNPGPDMNFEPHQLDYLLIEAGYRVGISRK